MSTRPTISQVAQMAKVSNATVSRYFNNTASVRASTAKSIAAAVKALNYPLADPADEGEQFDNRIILINVPDIANPFYNDIIEGAKSAALNHDYTVLVNIQQLNKNTLPGFINMFKNKSFYGAIILNVLSEEYFNLLYGSIPFVQCAEYTEGQNLVSYVTIDDFAATRKLMEYLISAGHRDIAILLGPNYYNYSRHRKQSYICSLEAAGIPVNPNWIVQIPSIDFNLALSASQLLVEQKEPPSAIFAVSDVLASAAIRACRLMGYSVPEDIVVAGFDNVNIAQASYPSITTVNQPKYQLGYTACELLIERLETPTAAPRQVLLDTELIIRESTQSFAK